MVSLTLRQDPLKQGFYSLEEAQWLTSEPAQFRNSIRSHAWRPPTDVYETETAIVVRVEIAGMSEQDFFIQLEGRSLSIRGTRTEQPERRAYHQMEIRFGEFSAEVELPAPVLSEGIEAVYQNGFLRLALPKASPTRIKVE